MDADVYKKQTMTGIVKFRGHASRERLESQYREETDEDDTFRYRLQGHLDGRISLFCANHSTRPGVFFFIDLWID
jgi:hypothetical protein